MSILDKHIEFVNEQAIFHEKRGEIDPKSFKAQLHQATSNKFRVLLKDIEEASRKLDEPPKTIGKTNNLKPIQLSLTIEDIEGLPEELIAELNLTDRDKTEFAIVNAIEEAGGILSLDRLLIALYKKTGEIHKRNNLYPKLSRMASKESIYFVPGKKGFYSIDPIKPEDVPVIFGMSKTQEDEDFDLI